MSRQLMIVLLKPKSRRDKGIEVDLSPPKEFINFCIIAILFLLAAFVFRIRESINIDQGTLSFSLQKNQINIPLTSIRALTPIDVWNYVKIETIDSNFTLNVRNFKRKKIEAFFVANGLYAKPVDELNEQQIYRDREEPHDSPLPHHAAYGSVLRGSADPRQVHIQGNNKPREEK